MSVAGFCAVLQCAAIVFNWSEKPVWMYSTSVRTAEVKGQDGKIKTVKFPFGWSKVNIEKCKAPGVAFSDTAPVLPPEGVRECETKLAGRTADDNPPFLAMTAAKGWSVECVNAQGSVETTRDKLIFGDGTLRLWYRAVGDKPSIRLIPPGGGKRIEKPFSALSLWIYGYRNHYDSRLDPDYVVPVVTAEFEDRDGKRFSLRVDHTRGWGGYWFQHLRHLGGVNLQKAMQGGCVFRGLVLSGFKNKDYSIAIDMTSLCLFRKKESPIELPARPKRPYALFPGQPQGVNTGAGTLEFPTTPDTVIPPGVKENPNLEFRFPANPEVSWDDLAFRWKGGEWVKMAQGGGVVPRAAAKGGTFNFRRVGNSVVLDMKCALKGEAEKVSFGEPVLGNGSKKLFVPYLYGMIAKSRERPARPGVMVFKSGGETLFMSSTFDWYLTGSSAPFGATNAPFGGVVYFPRTDGKRNPCYERVVWSVSPEFSEVLPNIANPPSPYRKEAGERAFCFTVARGKTRETLVEEWRRTRRDGMNRVFVNDHEDMWRDYMESFTFKTNAAPLKGGDAAQLAFGRQMREGFGYRYGSYNNFSDYPPTNENWNPDYVNISMGGDPTPSWIRCYLPKPSWAATMCERLCNVIAKKFPFDNCYSDVSTAYSPWERQDFDARAAGAGTMAASFYAYGEILRMQQGIWKGPVHSEGLNHPYYAGLTTGDFARDDFYFGGNDFPGAKVAPPWIVDYDLLRIHPLGCGIAMGSERLFYGTGRFKPKNASDASDRYVAAVLAFGHGPRLDGSDIARKRGYFMVLPMSSAYSTAKIASIRYGDGKGNLISTSKAIACGAVNLSHIRVSYDNGVELAVNGSMDTPFKLEWNGAMLELPPNGYIGVASNGDRVFSGAVDGRRVDVSKCKDFVYMDGRGKFVSFPEGGSDGAAVRLFGNASMYPVDGAEEVILYRGTKTAELPYKASKVIALDFNGKEMLGVGKVSELNGRTRLGFVRGVHSYRVWR